MHKQDNRKGLHIYRGSKGKPNKQSSKSSAPVSDGLSERFVWVLTFLLGRRVSVRTRDGRVFEGALHTAVRNAKGGFDVVLCIATCVSESSCKVYEQLVISGEDVVSMNIRNVPIASTGPGASRGVPGLFMTDTEMSGATTMMERKHKTGEDEDEIEDEYDGEEEEEELKPWVADEEDKRNMSAKTLALVSACLDDTKMDKKWDQYKVNQERFGVTTDFDQEFYTPSVDKNSEAYRNAADRAREIKAFEAKAGRSSKLVELTDEELAATEQHSSSSSSSSSTTKYIPPHLRKNKQPEPAPSPATTEKKPQQQQQTPKVVVVEIPKKDEGKEKPKGEEKKPEEPAKPVEPPKPVEPVKPVEPPEAVQPAPEKPKEEPVFKMGSSFVPHSPAQTTSQPAPAPAPASFTPNYNNHARRFQPQQPMVPPMQPMYPGGFMPVMYPYNNQPMFIPGSGFSMNPSNGLWIPPAQNNSPHRRH